MQHIVPLKTSYGVNSDLITMLFHQPYIQVPFPLSNAQINEAVEAFFSFLTLPELVKNHIDVKISPLHRRGDIGFKHRKASDDLYRDDKEFFHFHPLILEKYATFLNENPIVENFMKLALPLWEGVYSVVYEILSYFESDYPGTLSKIFKTDEPHILLRFLKYEWSHSGLYLAKPHYDAGSFTLALAESCQGLRIGTKPEDLKIINHEEDKAIFMVSSNFNKIINTELLSPGWHDVIQMDETKIGKSFARWAVVAFIEGHNVGSLSREETHKWYAE